MPRSAAATRPNILFIFVDDSGWGDFSCYGSPVTNKQGQVITPNIDRFASQGTRFTQGYVAAPICSPSRVGVLTGIEPARYAIYSFLDNKTANASRNMADWLQSATVSCPRLFQQAGYKTGQFGKWHMGGGRDVNNAPFPQDYGFDESLVAFEGMGNRVLYTNDSLSIQNADVPGTIDWVEWYEGAGKHTDAALKFMTNSVNAGKPFYIHVPYNDTHSPYNVPPGQENDFDHITSDTTGKLFLGELHNLDKQIGRLIDAVDGLGIATNTLMVIIGDNGAPNDALETLLNRNGGLRGGKGNLYEGGFREAYLIRWPGTVPAGVVNSNTVVSTLDLLPTYCSFAGIALPNAPFAGEDMSDVFRGSTRSRRRPLFWEYGTVSGLSPASPKLAVRDGNFKFMRNPDGTRRELYMIPQDRAEATNLVNKAAYAAIVTNLEAQLMTWYDENVLGNVGETFSCSETNFSGIVLSDAFTVTGGNSPNTGFATNAGVNYKAPGRFTGLIASNLFGYRLGSTGGTSPRQASDFSISTNRLAVAPRNGNGRFELSANGTSGYNFGSFLAGQSYEISLQLNITTVGTSYAQRLSFGLSDVSDVAVGDLDLGLQIGTDGGTGLGVFKRIDAGSDSGGADINTRLTNGLPIGTPINLALRVTDSNSNVTDYSSSYEILINGAVANSGVFRFNGSMTDRFLILDVAAHEGPVYYDNLQIIVTANTNSTEVCRKPILSLAESGQTTNQSTMRVFWSAQPGLTVRPEVSHNTTQWTGVTNNSGTPISVTTPHGSIQWLDMSVPASNRTSFIRLRRD